MESAIFDRATPPSSSPLCSHRWPKRRLGFFAFSVEVENVNILISLRNYRGVGKGCHFIHCTVLWNCCREERWCPPTSLKQNGIETLSRQSSVTTGLNLNDKIHIRTEFWKQFRTKELYNCRRIGSSLWGGSQAKRDRTLFKSFQKVFVIAFPTHAGTQTIY